MTRRDWGLLLLVAAAATAVAAMTFAQANERAVLNDMEPVGCFTAQWDLIHGSPTTTVVGIIYLGPGDQIAVRYAGVRVPERLVPKPPAAEETLED